MNVCTEVPILVHIIRRLYYNVNDNLFFDLFGLSLNRRVCYNELHKYNWTFNVCKINEKWYYLVFFSVNHLHTFGIFPI